jgi:formate dehydrogenase (NADP+) alpha subunit
MHLKNLPGRELPLIYGLMKALLDRGATLPAGGEAIKNELATLSLAELAQQAGIPEEAFLQAAGLLAGKSRVAIIFGADLMRSQDASTKIAALADLAVLTGAAADAGCGIFPIDAKNNTVGLLDMGVAPDLLPGLQPLAEAGAFGASWGTKLPTTPGKDLWGIVEGIEQGAVKALYLMGCDLASFPDNARIRKALGKLELLIVQDIFQNDSLQFAHVVFPAAAPAEKSGSFTSIDNRVQSILKSTNAPGEAKEDWEILSELYRRLTSSAEQGSPALARKEITALGKSYAPDAKGMHKAPAAVNAQPSFAPVAKLAPEALPKFQLLVGPIGYHNGTSTTRSENNLSVSPAGYVELHHADAASLGITDGGRLKLSSGNGAITATAKVSAAVQPGLLFAPYHFRELNANSLLKGSCNLVEVKVEKG